MPTQNHHESGKPKKKATRRENTGPIDVSQLRKSAFLQASDTSSESDSAEHNDITRIAAITAKNAARAISPQVDAPTTVQQTCTTAPHNEPANHYVSYDELIDLISETPSPTTVDTGFVFTSEDQDRLCINEHNRFVPASKKVGHALINKTASGTTVQQFSAPGGTNSDTPAVRPLLNIELFNKYGTERAKATTPNGTEMVALRSIQLKVDLAADDAADPTDDNKLWFFSPKASHMWRGDVFWGSADKNPPHLRPRDGLPKTLRHELADAMAEEKEVGSICKLGSTIVEHKSVAARELDPTRTPDQNTVMQGSAIDAYKDFYESYADVLSTEARDAFQQAEMARPHYRGGSIKSQRRPEWLHLVGHSLTPVTHNPQTASNLAAAPKYLNTKMMTSERVAKWHALKRPMSKISVMGEFKMLFDSDILHHGKFQIKITEHAKTVTLHQQINPFVKYPCYSKPTDIMQSVLVTHSILTNAAHNCVSISTAHTDTAEHPISKLYSSAFVRTKALALKTPPLQEKQWLNPTQVASARELDDEPEDGTTICSTSTISSDSDSEDTSSSADSNLSNRKTSSTNLTTTADDKMDRIAKARRTGASLRTGNTQGMPRLSTYSDWQRTVAAIESKYGRLVDDDGDDEIDLGTTSAKRLSTHKSKHRVKIS